MFLTLNVTVASSPNAVLVPTAAIVQQSSQAIVFTAAQGVGVAFSALSVLVYQGALTLLAGVVKPLVNINGSNGVIHVIDAVILPK